MQIIKRNFIVLFLVLYNITSFAVKVSDNDGAAFITKSEFDTLKSNFQSQLSYYHSSIDSKVEEAIAAYLKGVKKSNDKQKKLLCYGWQEAGYFENDNMHYKYARPEWSCKIEGIKSSLAGKSGGSTTAASTGTFYVISTYQPAVGTKGSCEVDLEENTKVGKKQDWIWKGYYTNVKWNISCSDVAGKVPTDKVYSSITNFFVDGPTFDVDAGKYDNSSSINVRRCVVWNYYNTTYPTTYTYDGIVEDIGPYDCVSSSYANTFSALYDKDEDNRANYGSDLANWDRYIIGFKESTKKCNVYNDSRYFGEGNSGTSAEKTETHNSFISATTREGESQLFHHQSSGYPSSVTGMPVSRRSFNEGDTIPAYTGITFDKSKYIPVIGGIKDMVSSKNIRQELDGLQDIESLPSYKVNDLSLLAGLPICIEKKDTKCKWNMKFNDTSKNYKVWFSYEPFDKNYSSATGGHKGEPNDALDLVKIKVDGTGEATFGIVKSGSGKVEWIMNKDSAVYCKWAVVDATGAVIDEHNGVLKLKDCNMYNVESTS